MKLTTAYAELIRKVVAATIAEYRAVAPADEVRSVDWVARHIGRAGKSGRQTVCAAIKSGKLRATLVGKSYAILDSAIKEWLDSKPKKKSGSALNTLQQAAPQPSRTEA